MYEVQAEQRSASRLLARASTLVVISRMRWAAVALSMLMALIASPAPISRPLLLLVSVAMGLYNIPASLARRLPGRAQQPLAALTLIGDFGACTAWVLLTGNDPNAANYVVYMLVGVEVAVLWGRAATVTFIGAFLAVFAGLYLEQSQVFGHPYPAASHLFRSAVVVIMTIMAYSLSADSRRQRLAAEDAAARAEVLARSDPMTGLGNRRALDERLALEWARADRFPEPLALVMVDVDNLKQVNDQRGHEVGDHLLREVSDRLMSVIRAGDFVARTGGDEFVIVCPRVDGDAAAQICRKLVAAVAARPLLVGEQEVHLSVSAGWATRLGTENSEELLRQADRCLYRAKQAGGSRSQGRPDALSPAPASAAAPEGGSVEELIQLFAERLPEPQGQVLVQREVLGLGLPDIGERLGMSVAEVAELAAQARLLFKTLFVEIEPSSVFQLAVSV
ncbi:MAG: GGDEF domain-containing protein [Candidatus Dormibacteria bacterium]